MRRTMRSAAGFALAAALTSLPGIGRAELTAGVGADYFTGPRGQSARDVMGFVAAPWRGIDFLAAAARYDHSDLGPGFSVTGAAGLPLSSTTSLQLLGGRTAGEHDYRAWRFQLGPSFGIGGGRTMGLFYSRSGDNLGPASTGFSSELGLPVTPSLLATARGAVASVDGGGTNLQGSGGLIWSASQRLVLLTELGLGRDVIAFPQTAPSQGGLGILGRGTESERDYVSGPALLVGLRFLIH